MQPIASAAPAVVVERPPPGLARGQYAAPPWVIGVVGGTVAMVGLAWTLWRWRRARRPR
jgi:hypothetical protein